jgi:hypothetical protein
MDIEFVIKSFDFGVPVLLQHPLRRGQFLSKAGDYTPEPVEWIFEQEGANIVIRSGDVYLGAPNINGLPYSYTTKYQWTLVSITGDNIVIRYADAKFDPTKVRIVIASPASWSTFFTDIVTVSGWLGFIVSNYSSLPDRVFFLSGKYSPIMYESLTEDIIPIGPVLQITRDCSIPYVNEPPIRALQAAYRKQHNPKGITIVDHFLSRMGLPAAPSVMSYASDIAVTRAAIRRRPLAEYRRLLDASSSPIDAAVIERLFMHLISGAA